MKEIASFGNISWKNLDFQLMNTRLEEFRASAKQLPARAMRDWPAYCELLKVIQDFSEQLPLLEALHGPMIQARHWNSIVELMKYDKLRPDLDSHVLKVPLGLWINVLMSI